MTKNHQPSWSKLIQGAIHLKVVLFLGPLKGKHWHNIRLNLWICLTRLSKQKTAEIGTYLLVIVLTFMSFDLSYYSWKLSSHRFEPRTRTLSVLTLPSSSIPSKAGQCDTQECRNVKSFATKTHIWVVHFARQVCTRALFLVSQCWPSL